jgi:hypothetical protein
MNVMDHEQADGEELPSRYVAGELEDSERGEFEAHLIECMSCLDGVEAAEGLRRGLLAATEADTVRIAVTRRRRERPSPRFVLALAAALACWLVPLVFLGMSASRKERELAAALSALEAERAARPAPAPSGQPVTATAEAGEAERLREENVRLAAALADARGPQVNVPVLLLSAVRAAPGDAAPARFAVDPGAAWVVLSLELEAEAGARGYTVAVADGRGRPVWKGSGARLREEALTVALPASLLPSGRYRATVSVEGGRGGQAAAYAFEVVRP